MLCFDRLQTHLEGFVQEGVAGLGQDAVSNLVQVSRRHVVDDLVSGGRNHGLAKAVYSAPDGRWSSMMDRSVELGESWSAGGFP